jgi:hypothetical protein
MFLELSVQWSLRFIYESRGEGSVRRYRDEDVEGRAGKLECKGEQINVEDEGCDERWHKLRRDEFRFG